MINNKLRRNAVAAGLVLALVIAVPAQAWEEAQPNPQVLTESFLAYHPDVKHRLLGIEALEKSDFDEALKQFQRASKFADKVSQAMVSEIYELGLGVTTDRSLAYVWMDLAAERGYTTFVVKREKLWDSLSQAEQQQAIASGEAIYKEYGDAVAKPRIERKLNHGRRGITGSRTGFVGTLTVMVPGPTGAWITLDGSQYYADKYWRPKDYFEWQDRVWDKPPAGTVSVGDIAASPEPDNGAATSESPSKQ